MNYIFFGTPEFAAIILKKLIEADFTPAAIVTNPDRPVGRKKVLTAPAVKQLLEVELPLEVQLPKSQIVILQPDNLLTIRDSLFALRPEFGILAAYGKIIPKEIINIFPKGIIVVHPSLLPKYRGATPIQSAILADEQETGTTLILMDEKVDHGPVLANCKSPIADSDTYEPLSKKLAELSGDLLIETLPKYLAGEIKPQEQDHVQATYTKKLTTEDGFVNYNDLVRGCHRDSSPPPADQNDAHSIWLKIRALNPEPGVYTILQSDSGQFKNGRRMKILSADWVDGKLILKKIQFEGEKPKIISRSSTSNGS